MKPRSILFSLIISTSLFAGGDNRVSMTDLKEALYNLVVASGKTEKEIDTLKNRVTNIEPLPSMVERNGRNISLVIERLNTLGIQSDPLANEDISNEITRFVEQNTQLLPASARGVR